MGADPDEYHAMRKAIYIDEAWPVTLWLIRSFSESAHRDGREFVLIDGRRFDDNVGTVYTNEDLEAFCDEHRIPYIDLYQGFDEISAPDHKSDFFLVDGHPNALGNRRISKYIADDLAPLIREDRADATAEREPSSSEAGENEHGR
jgi:hypothetical protein